jgi:ADP-ribose pyrophosphatase YjhB (NUDIX family)
MNTQHWDGSERRLLLDRPPWLRVWEQDVTLPGGHRIDGYLLTEGRDYAMIFALTEDGQVPLVTQYKHGAGKSLFDLPAGYLDDADEPPLACAQRELLEETGFKCQRWRLLGSYVIDANRSRTRTHLFLATGGRRVSLPRLDATEDLTCSLHSLTEVMSMLQSGTIETLASAAGIMLAVEQLRIRGG